MRFTLLYVLKRSGVVIDRYSIMGLNHVSDIIQNWWGFYYVHTTKSSHGYWTRLINRYLFTQQQYAQVLPHPGSGLQIQYLYACTVLVSQLFYFSTFTWYLLQLKIWWPSRMITKEFRLLMKIGFWHLWSGQFWYHHSCILAIMTMSRSQLWMSRLLFVK